MFDTQVGEITDPKLSVRPDYSILIYPVTSFSDKYGHSGSRASLLNNDLSVEKIEKYSNEKNIKTDTPPTFLVHAFDDPVSVLNSIEYAKALKAKNIPTELHLYDTGGHGFSMKKSNKGPVANWPDRLADWMKQHNWMK
jgi:acetyl esterase/lipase